MCLKKQKEQKNFYQNQAINKKVMSISNSFISHFWRGTRNCSYRANFNPKLFFLILSIRTFIHSTKSQQGIDIRNIQLYASTLKFQF